MEQEALPFAKLALGDMLRELRASRGISQLELALRCEISSRHLSFVETGRSQPGREIVERLGEELELPLTARNALHLAAGYAPRYRETSLRAPEMSMLREALSLMLAQQSPYPAFFTDTHWNLIEANPAMTGLLTALRPEGPVHNNVLHQIFDPEDIRPFLLNWHDVAGDVLRYLRHQVLRAPWDDQLAELLDALLAYPGLPRAWKQINLADAPAPVMKTVFKGPNGPLSFVSAITHFGTALDLTAEQIRVESLFPADSQTRDWCAARAGQRCAG